MTDLYEDDEEENQTTEQEELPIDTYQPSSAEARRKLEELLAEKRLKDELDDF